MFTAVVFLLLFFFNLLLCNLFVHDVLCHSCQSKSGLNNFAFKFKETVQSENRSLSRSLSCEFNEAPAFIGF
jgi:hypothetical protein